ncbi:MAG: NAD(P)-binding domain-containing protein [Patescibacteria group bacterium]|nr:NAD(P)-binding domain-containing protein [Patescibacteria group bacterium]
MKKVAILGAGMVGQTLAGGFSKHGYEVVIGTHDVSKHEGDPSLSHIPVLPYADAAKEGELIVFAVKGSAAEDVAKEIAESLKGKTVIDTTNPIADAAPEGGVLNFFTSLHDSLMERLQKIVPEARFVKAWNSVGASTMVNPDFGGVRPSMFICGNDEVARKEVATLLDQFGWDTEDMGGAVAARAIEPLCILWCIPGIAKNDWGKRAFKLLR